MKKDKIYFARKPKIALLNLDISLNLPSFILGVWKRHIIQGIF